LFIKNGNNYTCNLTFAKIEEIYAGTGDTKASMPQLIYSGNDTRSIYCNVEQENEDAFSFDFNIGAIGITNTGYKEKHIVLIMESDNSISFNREYTLEYQENMIACKFTWNSRQNKYECDKTYAQIKDIYYTNRTFKTALPFLIKQNYEKSFCCGVDTTTEDNHLVFVFTFCTVPTLNYNLGDLRYFRLFYKQDGTITYNDITVELQLKLNSNYFQNGVEITGSQKIQLTDEVRNSIATSLMIGASNGSIASFDDGGNDMPLKSCIVDIEPVQSGSGDPSPSNVRPISGWTECNLKNFVINLWNEEWENGYYDASGNPQPNANTIRSKNFIQVMPNMVIRPINGTDNNGRFNFYDKDKNWIGTTTGYNYNLTIPSNCYYMLISTGTAYGNTYKNDISINYPSTDTSYHAYTGQNYNIQFPSEAGTVYGGTLDVTNGVLTVNYAYIDMGSCNWTKMTNANGDYFRSSNTSSLNAHVNAQVYCSQYISKTIWLIRNINIDKAVACEGIYIECRDSSYTDADTFKTAMNGVQLVYELATPQTYNLTPTEVKTLLGINNIFADCGDADVEYVRDATSIINYILSKIENI
jgi:hypothetical protein